MQALATMTSTNTETRCVIVGLGATGLACARYLSRCGRQFSAVDSRDNPPGLDEWRSLYPQARLHLGSLDADFLLEADELILSPGLDPACPPFARAAERGITLLGDVELFSREAHAPVLAITGTNAKSTVTTLVGLMARSAGVEVKVGGNLGTPVLDLLDPSCELYVLELSSFQLETVVDFRADVAAFLNFFPDHMDRYESLDRYRQAKLRVFRHAGQLIYNRDDQSTRPSVSAANRCCGFGLEQADDGDFGRLKHQGSTWLAQGRQALLPVDALQISGLHNQANALAALAIGSAAGLPMPPMLRVLREFSGLPHRGGQVAHFGGVRYVDDSKATNVGAAVASIRGLAERDGRIVLIAGGIAKEVDFSSLREQLITSGRAAVLIGQSAQQISECIGNVLPHTHARDMASAVRAAQGFAQPGDIVLLAPACASFDMFCDYGARGDAFAAAVLQLAAEHTDD